MTAKLKKAAAGVCLLATTVWLDGTAITSNSDGTWRFHNHYVAHAFDETRFKTELTTLLQSEEMISGALQELNIPASHREVYSNHLAKLWGNDLVVQVFVDEVMAILPALNLNTRTRAREFGMAYSASWFQEKAMKGILRLNSEAIRIQLKATQGFFENIPPRACRAAVFEEMSAPDMMKYEVDYLVTRPQHEVRSYLSSLREAVIAELSDYPSVKTVTPSQRQILDQVLSQRLEDALDAHPNGEELWIGLNDLRSLSDQDLCYLTAKMMEIAVNEQGEVGDWLVRYMIQ